MVCNSNSYLCRVAFLRRTHRHGDTIVALQKLPLFELVEKLEALDSRLFILLVKSLIIDCIHGQCFGMDQVMSF